ncbi:hypothetical protein [Alteribacillus sp. HJP-4]|uniref:hypothetical protein n=1 Tax=Alteribacillus sp. HJP-4 TaxID=2775394 RepID=UPI0035CD0777
MSQYEFEGALFKPDTTIKCSPFDGYVSFTFEDKYKRNFGLIDFYKFGTEYEISQLDDIDKERLNKIVSDKDGLIKFLETKVNELLDGGEPPHDHAMSREEVKADVENQIKLINLDRNL